MRLAQAHDVIFLLCQKSYEVYRKKNSGISKRLVVTPTNVFLVIRNNQTSKELFGIERCVFLLHLFMLRVRGLSVLTQGEL